MNGKQTAKSTHKKKPSPRQYVMQVWRTRGSWEPNALVALGFAGVVLASMVLGIVAVAIRWLMGAR